MSSTAPWSKRARHSVESWLVERVEAAVRRQPMERIRARGEALGRLAYGLSGSRRRVALENVARAFPDAPVAEQDRIVRGMFEHFSRLLVELIRFRSLTDEEILAIGQLEGAEHVNEAYARGKGALFVGGHFGFWEMQAIEHALTWKPISMMMRPLDNPRLHAVLEQIRTRTGNSTIGRQGSIRRILRALASNRGVAILIDQHLHSSEAVYVNFFGRPAATTSVIASLVLRTGAAVIPVFAVPLPGGRYRFIYAPPIPPPVDDSPEAIHDFTQRCTDVIEDYVRRYPELWLWMHRRWRALPASASTSVPGHQPGGDGESEDAGSQDPAYR